jgi:hypothetical protein
VTEINARGRFVAQTQTARSDGMAKVPVIDIDLYKIDQNNNPDNRPFATVLALIDTESNGCAIDIQQATDSNLLPIGQSTSRLGDVARVAKIYKIGLRLPGTNFLFSTPVGSMTFQEAIFTYSFILGMDFLAQFSLNIDVSNDTVALHKNLGPN